MPEKRRLSLSFSLAQREQRDAWERLSAVAPGQRMEAVCRIINGYMEQQELLEAVPQNHPGGTDRRFLYKDHNAAGAGWGRR